MILIDTYNKDTLATESKTLYTKGGRTVGLSFSSGFFYTENLSDRPYYLRARQDENMALLADRPTFSDVSIGALGHLYYKVSPTLRTGPAVGIAVSPFDGKSRYLIGWSVLLGKEKMFGLSVGKAWAKQKQLSSAVRSDAQGQYLPKGTSAVPTFDRIVNTWFVGLTYNLVSTRK